MKRSVSITASEGGSPEPQIVLSLREDDKELCAFYISACEPAKMRDIVYLWLSDATFEVIQSYTSKMVTVFGQAQRHTGSLNG